MGDMRNYKIVLQYEGTRYQGWQRQESTDNTIQGKLEALLSRMCGKPVEIQGSGRTDAGVHAMGQVVSALLDTELDAAGIMEYMNRYLPEDIGVLSVEAVSARFHSRLNAKGKTYCYRIINSSAPHIFERRYACVMPQALDIEAMRAAAGLLVGTHDYKSFTSARRGKKSTVRTVSDIRIDKEGDILTLTFNGDGFLFHMVRILAGTLMEVGRGERRPEDMAAILEAQNRDTAGALAPACGLMLMEVRYE